VFDLVVSGKIGAFVFIVCTLQGLILLNFVAGMHRNSQTFDKIPESQRNAFSRWFVWFQHGTVNLEHAPEALALSQARQSTWNECGLSTPHKIVLLLCTIGIIALTYVGCVSLQTFSFEFGGLAGDLLLQFGGEDQVTRSFSVYEIASSLTLDSIGDSRAVMSLMMKYGVVFIQSTFLIFAVVFPILRFFVLLFIWLVPMSLQTSKIMLYVFEICNTWAALDAFIIAVIVCTLEIESFSHFMEKDDCEPIQKLFHLQSECFKVKARLDHGSWVLVLAGIGSILVAWYLSGILRQCIERRESRVLELKVQQEEDLSYIPLSEQ
jgi:hypothetical protein